MLESRTVVPLQVSKWVKIPLLVDVSEMKELLCESTPPFKIYDVQRVTRKDEGIYDSDYFLEKYSKYIEALKKGEVPLIQDFRSIFSAVWSVTDEALYSLPAHEEKRLLKVATPCVQTQLNQIRYSKEENAFRTQVYSTDSICWGIQVGFPHIYLNPKTYQATNTREFPNMALFLAIQRWIRKQTAPTPFVVGGQIMNTPIRLGKKCFAWIANHPQLAEHGIAIDCT